MSILCCIVQNGGTVDVRPAIFLRFLGSIPPMNEVNLFNRCFSPLPLVNQLAMIAMLSTATGISGLAVSGL